MKLTDYIKILQREDNKEVLVEEMEKANIIMTKEERELFDKDVVAVSLAKKIMEEAGGHRELISTFQLNNTLDISGFDRARQFQLSKGGRPRGHKLLRKSCGSPTEWQELQGLRGVIDSLEEEKAGLVRSIREYHMKELIKTGIDLSDAIHLFAELAEEHNNANN